MERATVKSDRRSAVRGMGARTSRVAITATRDQPGGLGAKGVVASEK